MSYHRHASAIIPIEELVARAGGSFFEPFSYCPFCKCIPTTLTAPDPEPGMAYDSAGNPHEPCKTYQRILPTVKF